MNKNNPKPIQQLMEKERDPIAQDRVKKILHFLYRYVGDYQVAEDLTVETFLTAHKKAHTYTEMGKFNSWLYMIATNIAKRELQRKKHRGEVSLNAPIDDTGDVCLEDLLADDKNRPDYNARQAELRDFINAAIKQLDPKYKKVLLLCDVEGMSYQDVARRLKTKPVTVGTRLRRARKILFDVMKNYGF